MNIHVFATDLDPDAITVGRAGLYPASALEGVEDYIVQRYFLKEPNGQYRIRKTIRERVIFAPQNLIKDPVDEDE